MATRWVVSRAAVKSVVDSAAELVDAMPTTVAAQDEVYVSLQRLASNVDSAIFAADGARSRRLLRP